MRQMLIVRLILTAGCFTTHCDSFVVRKATFRFSYQQQQQANWIFSNVRDHTTYQRVSSILESTTTFSSDKASNQILKEVEGNNAIGNVVILIPSEGPDTMKTSFGHNSPVGEPTIIEAVNHLINKICWCSDGRINGEMLSMKQIESDASSKMKAMESNCLIAFYLTDESDLATAQEVFESRNEAQSDGSNKYPFPISQFAIECGKGKSMSAIPHSPLVGFYDSSRPSAIAQTFPWTTSASHMRLAEQMTSLFNRWTSDDYTTAILLYFQTCTPSTTNIPWVQYSIDATWEKGPIQNAKEFFNMVDKCGDCIVKCVADDTCRTCLGELTELDTRDQVASYRTIVSFESDLLRDFSLCILQKNNIFECDATIPTLPNVPPITQWRGRQLTQEDARQILIGHLDDDDASDVIRAGTRGDISWKVACGANVAYDQFPSQNQIFYKSTNGKDMWYDPVFRVETIDGRHVWAKRHYKVRDKGLTPGTFRFSVLDNGVTSNEFWTIAGVADDLSWIVFHYAGAASAVGQRYLGGLLCTPDGSMPPPKQLEEAWEAVKKTGIQPWELFVVNNDPNAVGMTEAGPAPLDFYRKDVMLAKARK